MQTEYYQMYQDNNPLIGKTYMTIKDARKALKSLNTTLQDVSDTIGFNIHQRSPAIPIRNSVSFRLTYADNSTRTTTFRIHLIKLQPVYNQ